MDWTNLYKRPVAAFNRAALATARGSLTGSKVALRYSGLAVIKSLDAIETADNYVNKIDKAFEDAAGTAGRETIGLVSDDARPHGEKAGRSIYKLGKIAVNLTGLPAGAKQISDFFKGLRR